MSSRENERELTGENNSSKSMSNMKRGESSDPTIVSAVNSEAASDWTALTYMSWNNSIDTV
jgi:hypothetical protein